MNDSFGHLNRMIGLQLEMHVYHAPRRHDEGEGKHVGRCHGAGPVCTGFARAVAVSRLSSLRSPHRKRYRVPLRPCALRVRSIRRGVHQAHSSACIAHHRANIAAAPPSTLHGEVSWSSTTQLTMALLDCT